MHGRRVRRSDHVKLSRVECPQSSLQVIDLARLETAINNWSTGGWHTTGVFQKYNLALPRCVTGGSIIRWFGSANW
jgi:hypothetical protein